MEYQANDKQLIRDCEIGEGTKIWNFVNMYCCKLGKDCMVGHFVEIQEGVTIGDRTRVQSHTFICDMVDIGSDVFVGHGVMFINDTMPPQVEKEKWKPTFIGDRASLGSNSTILPVTVGHDAGVGAGATVTRDVPPGAIVAGCPAKILRYKEGFGPDA